jgi:hypothetical protein
MFKIYDWACNDVLPHMTFDTFEDAWEYILGDLTDLAGLTDVDYQEYYVERAKPVKVYRFLDPNDPRAKI